MKPLIPILVGAGFLAFSRSKATSPAQQRKTGIPFTNLVGQLPVHATCRYGSRNLSQITDIVIHHSAGPTSQTPSNIAQYHISPESHLKAGGAPGIAYHFVITPDGHIYQTQELNTISWHVGGNNTKSVGICLIGNFEIYPPTKEQYAASGQLIEQLRSQVPTIRYIKPHKAYSNTSCPGKYFDFSRMSAALGRIHGNGHGRRGITSHQGIGRIHATNPPGKYACLDGRFTDTRGRGACSYHGGYLISRNSQKKHKSSATPPSAAPEEIPVKPGIVTDWPTLLAFINRRRKLEVTAAEVRQAWQDFKSHEDQVKEDLSKKLKKELKSLHYQLSGGWLAARLETEPKILKSLIRSLKESFLPRRKTTWSFDELHTPVETIVDRQIDQWTPELIETLKRERQEYQAKQQAEQAAMERQAADPQTLNDFRAFFRLKGEKAMTPELKARYDTLVAASQLERWERQASEKRKVQAIDNSDIQFSDIIETKHTWDGHDLFVVKLQDRVERDVYNQLNARAKRLGGYYSSYSKGGAVPGFQFKTRQAAEQFLSLDEVERAQKERSTENMKEAAQRLEEGAAEALNRDRKMNTARRARMAASAVESAEATQRFARTYRNLAEAIDAGKLRFLKNIRYQQELSSLLGLLSAARISYARKVSDDVKKETGSTHQADMAWEKARHTAYMPEMVQFVTYPYPYIHKENIPRIVAELQHKKGYKMTAKRLAGYQNPRNKYLLYFDSPIMIPEARKIAFAPGLAQKVHIDPLKNSLQQYDRMHRLGLLTEELLRAALLELLPFLGEGLSEEQKQQKEIRQLEAKSLRMKIPGYFPTPKNVVQRMIERADIRPGESVLEPSAGKGNIADLIRSHLPENAKLAVIEREPFLVDILQKKGHNVLQGDFLQHRAKYDKIIMNPPFEKRQDIAHVRHAYKLLKPGGRIVAIMSEGSFSRSQGPDIAFQEWLSDKGTGYPLPEGTFNNLETRTNVRTRLVVIDKSASITGGMAGAFRKAPGLLGVYI